MESVLLVSSALKTTLLGGHVINLKTVVSFLNRKEVYNFVKRKKTLKIDKINAMFIRALAFNSLVTSSLLFSFFFPFSFVFWDPILAHQAVQISKAPEYKPIISTLLCKGPETTTKKILNISGQHLLNLNICTQLSRAPETTKSITIV